jgi:hypothetical protein
MNIYNKYCAKNNIFKLIVKIAFLALFMMLVDVVQADGFLLPPMNGNPSDFAMRRAGAGVNAFVKITVTNEGLFQIAQSALIEAGVDKADLVGAHIRLYCVTQEVAIAVSHEGLWESDDNLVFFGKPFEGPQSEANVYWLGVGGQGKRMEWRNAKPYENMPDTQTYLRRVDYRKYALLPEKYLPANDRFDHWFVGSMSGTNAMMFSLPTDGVVTSRPARFSAVLYGVSSSAGVSMDHTTRVKINGQLIGDITFDGRKSVTGACVFAADMLEASNAVWLKQKPNAEVSKDWVYLKEASLEYTRKLSVSDGTLIFQGQPGPANYKVQGFTSNEDFWLLDLSIPDAPVLLLDYSTVSVKNGVALRFGDDASSAGRYGVWRPGNLQKVATIEAVSFIGLANTNRQADYLVICPEAFQAQAERLVEWRASQGLTGLVVPLTAIYNEFSYGIADAGAIKQFLGYAYHHWQGTPPRYVLLAGSGSYDPKGYLLEARGRKSFQAVERIPVHMGPSPRSWTSLDGWFAQVNGPDKLVDLALGRLPAQNLAMMSNMVDKIIAFESVPPEHAVRKKALLVADYADLSMDAKAACQTAQTEYLSPGGFSCNTAFSDDLSVTAVRRNLFETVNKGVLLTCYFGHGDEIFWGDVILSTDDMAMFKNQYFPISLMMACRNGAFQNPLDGPCLMETMMRGAGRGASACIANTASGYGTSNITFSKGFLRSLAIDRAPRLGDSFLAGLGALHAFFDSTQELLYLNLFGDPAMLVNP